MALMAKSAFAVFFSVLVLAAVGISIAGWAVQPSKKNLLLAGVASGYMGTITSIGAPPMALIYQHAPGPRVRATISAFFVVGVVFSLGALATFGHFGLDHEHAAHPLPADRISDLRADQTVRRQRAGPSGGAIDFRSVGNHITGKASPLVNSRPPLKGNGLA